MSIERSKNEEKNCEIIESCSQEKEEKRNDYFRNLYFPTMIVIEMY